MPAGALSPIVTWSRVLIIADLPSMPRTCRRTAAEVKESALQAHRYVSGPRTPSGRGRGSLPGGRARTGRWGRGPCSAGGDLLHRAPLQREAAAPAFTSTAVVAELVDALA